MFKTLLTKIIGEGAVAASIEYLAEKKRLKNQLALKRLEGKIILETEKMNHAAEWAAAHIKNSGWKDEYVLIILSIPLVGVFIPGIADHMLSGFAILEKTPEWYRWLIVSVMAAIYGLKPAWDKFSK